MRKLARDGVASKRSITHAILGLFSEAYKLGAYPDSKVRGAISVYLVVKSPTIEKVGLLNYGK